MRTDAYRAIHTKIPRLHLYCADRDIYGYHDYCYAFGYVSQVAANRGEKK